MDGSYDNFEQWSEGAQQQAPPPPAATPQPQPSAVVFDAHALFQAMMQGFSELAAQLSTANAQSQQHLAEHMTAALRSMPAANVAPTSTTPSTINVTSSNDFRMSDIEHYKDKVSILPLWIDNCYNFFAMQPIRYPIHELKIRYIISRFSSDSRAGRWASTFLNREVSHRPSYFIDWNLKAFMDALFVAQGVTANYSKARQKLLDLKQTHSVSNYHTTFSTLAGQVGHEESFRDLYFKGLKAPIQEAIMQKTERELDAMSFGEFAQWSIEIDNRLTGISHQLGYYSTSFPDPYQMQVDAVNTHPGQDNGQGNRGRGGFRGRGRGRGRGQGRVTNPPPPQQQQQVPQVPQVPPAPPKPQVVQQSAISQEEYNRRYNERACFNCGGPGHISKNCPLLKPPK